MKCPNCGESFEDVLKVKRTRRSSDVSREHGKGMCPFCGFEGKVKKFIKIGGGENEADI